MSRATRTLTVAQVCCLMGVVIACSGDDTTSSTPAGDGGASSSGSSDALAPDAAPSSGCPIGCARPAPDGWNGPNAVWNDISASKPASCPAPYTTKQVEAHEGLTAAPATCACPTGSVLGAKCTATARVYTTASATCTNKAGFNEIQIDSSACSAELGAATDAIIVASTLAAENGACNYQPPNPVRSAPSFAKQTVACGLPESAACEGRPECVSAPAPSSPFTRLCIHKSGEELCPTADYGVRFVAFKSVDDQRTCDATCAGSVTGTATCGTKWGFGTKGSAACTGGSAVHPEALAVDDCIAVPNATAVIDPFKLAPSGLSCTLTTDTKPVGEAKSSGPITFCCNR